MAIRPTLGGIIPPVLTPTDERENVDEAALRKLVNTLIEGALTACSWADRRAKDRYWSNASGRASPRLLSIRRLAACHC